MLSFVIASSSAYRQDCVFVFPAFLSRFSVSAEDVYLMVDGVNVIADSLSDAGFTADRGWTLYRGWALC